MKVATLTHITRSQRLIAQLLLSSFLLESCHNTTIPTHLQQKEVRPSSYDHHLRLHPSCTHIRSTVEQVASLEQDPSVNQDPFSQAQIAANEAIILTSNSYPKTIEQNDSPTVALKAEKTESMVTTINQETKSAQHTYSKPKLKPARSSHAFIHKRRPTTNHAITHLLKNQILKNQKCIANRGLQIKFKTNEKGKLEGIIKNQDLKGIFSKRLPVMIESGFNFSIGAVKNHAWQKQYIHILSSMVYIGRTGLLGGGKKEKEKEKERNSETEDDELDMEAQHEPKQDEFAIENIQDFIEEGSINAEKAKDKEIVLVLGNTGSGKSTIINYLLGSEMKRQKERRKNIAIPKQAEKEWAKIGHQKNSETFFPNVYATPDSPFIYCDCPGFNDTRTEEEQLKTSIATQLIIHSAACIRGIIVVIDANDLIHGRGKSMRQVSLVLSQLLKEDIDLNAILFIFNDRTLDSGSDLGEVLADIHEEIKELEEIEKAKVEKISKQAEDGKKCDEEYKKTYQTLSILSQISTHKQNTCVIDLFDQFESKGQIEKLLGNLKPTSKEQFDFSQYDATRAKFNKQLDELVSNISSQLIPFVEASKSMYTHTEQVESCEERINFYQGQIASLNPEEANQHENKIQELQQQIHACNQRIAKLEEKKAASQNKVADLTKEKAELDTDEEVCYREYNCYGDSEIEYNGPPFTKRVITNLSYTSPSSLVNIDLKNEYINQEQGIYKAKYERDLSLFWLKPAEFNISIYIKKKHVPDNQARIEQINQELEQAQKFVGSYDQQMKETLCSRNHFQDIIICYTANLQEHKKQVSEQKQNLEEQLGRIQREKEAANIEINKQEKIKQAAADYLAERQDLIPAVYTLILQGIGNESSLTSRFKRYYQAYQAFSEQDADYASSWMDIDFPEYLLCPIAGEPFRDPVMTKCGHTFDHQHLSGWLIKSKTCPTCRKLVLEKDLVSNVSMRHAIEHFKMQQVLHEKQTIGLEPHPHITNFRSQSI